MPPVRRNRHSSSTQLALKPVSPMVRLWMLRILVKLNACRQFVDSYGAENVAAALGLPEWEERNPDQTGLKSVKAELLALLREAEQQGSGFKLQGVLRSNVARPATLVGLSSVDRGILAFVVQIHTDATLNAVADYLGSDLSSLQVFHALSVILQLPESDVRQALGTQGTLAKSGLKQLS